MFTLLRIFCCTLFLLISRQNFSQTFPQPGFICVPVADLVLEKIGTFGIARTATQAYQALPLSWGAEEKDKRICPRAHQGLMHEFVTVLAQEGDEVQIDIHNAFFITAQEKTPRTTYWTLKKNVRLFSQLSADQSEINLLPNAILFNNGFIDNTDVATLKMPFFNAATQQTYSAGTRFAIESRASHKIIVHIFNPRTETFDTLSIPRNVCHLQTKSRNGEHHAACIRQFVDLLRYWTHLPSGFIPLAWGGCSFKDIAKQTAFTLEQLTVPSGEHFSFWRRSDCTTPYSGFDTSGLILRAAQMCSIPYFAKNSTTAAYCLQELTASEQVHDGDLFWFPGYVGVISSVKENTIIGALSYSWGYGKVFEAPVEHLFKGIETIQELVNASHTNMQLSIMDAHGEVRKTVEQIKILKIESAWK